jgi:hypothetical protein
MDLLFIVIGWEVLFAVWWMIDEILYRKTKKTSSVDPIEAATERINRKKDIKFNIGMQLMPIIAWIIAELIY